MKVASLFSGCGGLDLGFVQGGFSIVEAHDSDQAAVAAYNANHNSVAKETNITSSFEFQKSIDVLIAGPPCQGFSTVGKNQPDDARNKLFVLTCEIAARHRPKIIVIENVAGIANRINRPLLNLGLSILREAQYHVETHLVDCRELGLPQKRRRLFVVARSKNRSFSLNRATSTIKSTLKDVLLGIPEADPAHTPQILSQQTKAWIIAQQIMPGQKLCNVRAGDKCVPTWSIPKAFGRTSESERQVLNAIRQLRRRDRRRDFGDADPVLPSSIAGHLSRPVDNELNSLKSKGFLREIDEYVDLTNTFNGRYRRLSWDEPSPTVDTRFGDSSLFLHPEQNRAMTVREAARIQGFPDGFQFPPNKTTSFRLIGNAVPPPVAAFVAGAVRELV